MNSGTFNCPAGYCTLPIAKSGREYCFVAGAITHFHLSKDEETNAHARRGGPANPKCVLEGEAAGQMPILRRRARNLSA